MDLTLITVVVGIAIVVLGIILAVFYLDKKRTEAFEAAATQLGLLFHASGDADLQGRFSSFQLFNQGRARKLRNLVVGETGEIDIAIFDYQFTTGSGKHSHTHVQTVASLESPDLQIPPFTMRPEGLFDKIGGVFGTQDIDFDSHPEFSKMFLLKSEAEEQVRDFFDASLLEFFQGKPRICVEAIPGRLIMYFASRKEKPSNLKQLFEEALSVYGLFVQRCEASKTA